ncbi:polysaccharide biosynthesis protein [Halorubrum sp. AJ67]|nr:polysaccharide biosynthesis protein [Halorubrum sp. AJ67]
MIEVFVRSTVQIALVFVGLELFGLVAGALMGTAAAVGIGLYMIPVRIGAPRRKEALSLLSFAKFSFFREFATKAYHNIDTAVISVLIGNSAVGLYNIPFRIALVLQVFSSAVSTSSFPEISHHDDEGNYERIGEILGDAMVFSAIVAIPATVGIFLLAEQIVITLFTSAFAGGASVAVLAVAIEIPSGFRGTLTSAIDGMDRPELTLRADAVLIGTNLVLDLVLVPWIGIIGAAIASLAGVTASTVYLGYLFVEKLEMPLTVFQVQPLAMEVIAALVMGGVVYGLRETLAFPQPWNVLLLVGSGIATYSIVLPAISRDIRLRLIGIVRDFL